MTVVDAALHPWPPAFSEAFLDQARRRFDEVGSVLVVGPLGSHRGALARTLANGSTPVVWGRESAVFSGPYSAVNHLLPALDARPDQPIEQVVEVALQILEATFGIPVVLVHEAELCDTRSVEVLTLLMARRQLSLVATIGPCAAASHPFADAAAVIDLAPLDDTAIDHLLGSRFGAVPHPTTVRMLAVRSQGAYAALKELADAGHATGQLKVIAGQLVTDVSVPIDDVDRATEFATSWWHPRLPAGHPARDAIDVASLLVELDRDEARAVFGACVLDAAVAAGLLTETADSIVVTSRIEALKTRRTLDRQRQLVLHQQYARRLGRTIARSSVAVRAASWHLAVDQGVPPDLAARAATRANRECRYPEALLFADAIAEGRQTSRVMVERCHALNESGRETELTELLRDLDLLTLPPDHLYPVLGWCSTYLTPAESADRHQRLRLELAVDDPRRAALDLFTLGTRLFRDDFALFRQDLRTLIGSGRLSAVNLVAAHSLFADALKNAGELDRAVEAADEAVALLRQLGDGAGAFLVESVLEVQILCQFAAMDLEGARAWLTSYSTPGVQFGNLGRLGVALWGMLALNTGDIGTAIAHAQLCLARNPASDPHRLRAWMEATSAQALVQVGDLDGVNTLIDASMQRPPHARRPHDLSCRIAQAFVHETIGDPETAITGLQSVIAEARAHGFVLQEIEAAALLVQVGGPVHLDALTRAVEQVQVPHGTTAVWTRFAAAMRANDMHDLVGLAMSLDDDGHAMMAAAVAQFTLDVARRATDMTPQQRDHLRSIADPVQHRQVTRVGGASAARQGADRRQDRHDD